ncbi:MAG: hypothetical protein WC044_09060 [Crocinitomicaceae bacterium]
MKYTLLFLFAIFNFALFSQGFTNDREKFTKEFHKTLSDYGKGDYSTFSKKDFPKLLLESSALSDEAFTKLVFTSNLILEKKLKPYPELYNYVYSMYSLALNKQDAASLNAWHNTIDKMLDARNVKKFEDFIELSSNFFSKRILSVASNYTWYYIGGTYKFDSDDRAFIRFENGSLICRVDNRNSKEAEKNPYVDSIVVKNTNGIFDPFLKRWEGSDGIVTWEKVGLRSDEVYAEINKYQLALKSPNFLADSVSFYTPYFQNAIVGQLTERAFVINREEDRIYPQFLSYQNNLEINNLRPSMNYAGGFGMKGSKFEGFGTKQNLAKLTILNKSKPFIVAKSTLFSVSESNIKSENTEIFVQLGEKDSITHPGASFLYAEEKSTIEISRTNSGLGQAPFENSFHQVDMYVPKLVWEEGAAEIGLEFGYGTSLDLRIAKFESKNYFDARLYQQVQGMETKNPLAVIFDYSYKYDEHIIQEGKLASALGKTVEQAKPMLLELARLGFIAYDTDKKEIRINEKLNSFVESRSGKRDYDNITFVSDLRPKQLRDYSPEQISKDPVLQAVKVNYDNINAERARMTSFGKLDLKNLDLNLVAVDQITLSDEQLTTVFPRNYSVSIKKNRDFNFVGFINSGKLEIDAEVSEFRYDEFKFNITKSNKTAWHVRPLSEQDGTRAITLKSEITGIVGELLIDDPKNRSGLNKEIVGYPQLKSVQPAKIFYNAKDIYRGAYDSTRFYFTVNPFNLDSLDNFSEKNLRFSGELTSSGIFPKFKQEVKIMPDYSFGFSTAAPTGGYSFYGTSAKYENKILLSNSGLQGAGTINFVNSTSISKALAFLPDSTIGVAEFVNREQLTGNEFPSVTGKEVFITYIPQKNLLKAKSNEQEDLVFFKGGTKMKGTVFITPQGMRGKGLMNFLTATLTSNDFSYKANDILADSSNFNLRNTNPEEGEGKITFKTDNVKANVSFKERKGVFISNGGSSLVYFPINEFKCKMDIFNWLMDEDKINMESKQKKDVTFDAGVELATSNFFSTNPKQDSLSFKAPKATYSIAEKVIYCDEINFVDIADARIYPSDKKITVRKKAKLDPIKDSKIVANYITKYHTFVKSNIDITGRRAYTAVGEYPYYDADGNLTFILMDKIGLDTSYQTIADGKVDENSNFHLSKEFDYYGKMSIHAANPAVLFDGATRVNHTCEKFERNWLSFKAEIDPKNIQIPVSNEMKNLNGTRISAGIVWRDSRDSDSLRIYPTFLSALTDKDDPIVMTANGVLQYDPEKMEFQIGPKAKFLNPAEKGNIITLNAKTCSLSGLGIVNLGMDYGEVKVDAYGDWKYDQKTGLTSMDLTMNLKMNLEKKPFEDIAARIQLVPGIPFMDLSDNNLEKAILEWSDAKTADKFKSDYTIKGEVKKLPDALADGITLTGITLQSYENNRFQEKGLVTTNGTAVLVNIFDKSVFKTIETDAFFLKAYSGAQSDKFSLLLSVTGGKSYFFDYTMAKKDGELRMMSSDTEFRTEIEGLKEDKKKSKNFKYDMTQQNIFVVKFKRLLGKSEE